MNQSLYVQAVSDLDRLSDHYAFVKPNDRRALDLMNAAAVEVMKELPDLCIAYGVSDEYRYAVSLGASLIKLTTSASSSIQAVSSLNVEMRKSRLDRSAKMS